MSRSRRVLTSLGTLPKLIGASLNRTNENRIRHATCGAGLHANVSLNKLPGMTKARKLDRSYRDFAG